MHTFKYILCHRIKEIENDKSITIVLSFGFCLYSHKCCFSQFNRSRTNTCRQRKASSTAFLKAFHLHPAPHKAPLSQLQKTRLKRRARGPHKLTQIIKEWILKYHSTYNKYIEVKCFVFSLYKCTTKFCRSYGGFVLSRSAHPCLLCL